MRDESVELPSSPRRDVIQGKQVIQLAWARQVMHVLIKDLHRLRWMIGAYIIALGANAITIVDDWTRLDRTINVWGFPLWLFGFAIVMVIIHDDSPVAPGAQWRALPLGRSAVVAAKLLAMIVVPLALPVLAEAAIFATYGLSAEESRRLLVAGARGTAAALCWVAVLAALFNRVHTFAAAMLFFSIGVGIASAAIPDRLRHPLEDLGETMPPSVGALLALISFGAIVIWFYHGRPGVAQKRIAIGALLAGSVIGNALAVTRTTPIPHFAAQDTDWRTVGIAGMVLGDSSNGVDSAGSRAVILMIDTTAPGVFGMGNLFGQLTFASGYKTGLSTGKAWWYRWTRLPLERSIILHRPMESTLGPRPSNVVLTRAQVEDVVSGRAGLTVETQVLRADVKRIDELSLADSAGMWGDRRVRILAPRIDQRVVEIALRWVSFEPTDVGPFAFVLVNENRGEAFELTEGGGYTSMSLMPTVQSGASINERTLKWFPSTAAKEPGPTMDAAWLRDARLRIIEWGPSRRYDITVPVTHSVRR
jgi:hypothetical protein